MNKDINKLREYVEKVVTVTGTTPAAALEELQKSYGEEQNDKIIKTCIFALSVDICFVYDATGSMHKYFKALNSIIVKVISNLKELNPDIEIRLSMVVYRDPEDGEGHIQTYQFNKTMGKFENFLRNIKVYGGSDECEDVIGALSAASKLIWENANRVLVLCSDAPCHGRQYHDRAGE